MATSSNSSATTTLNGSTMSEKSIIECVGPLLEKGNNTENAVASRPQESNAAEASSSTSKQSSEAYSDETASESNNLTSSKEDSTRSASPSKAAVIQSGNDDDIQKNKSEKSDDISPTQVAVELHSNEGADLMARKDSPSVITDKEVLIDDSESEKTDSINEGSSPRGIEEDGQQTTNAAEYSQNSWIKCQTDTGEVYYYNQITYESQWERPPSLGIDYENATYEQVLEYFSSNRMTDSSTTPLHLASAASNLAAVQAILYLEQQKTSGVSATCSAIDESQLSPIFYACEKHSPTCIFVLEELLNASRAYILQSLTIYNSGNSILHYAVEKGNEIMVEYLLKRDYVAIDAVNYAGETALHIAVSSLNARLVSILLSYGASTIIEDHLGQTPVIKATLTGNVAIVQILQSNQSTIGPHVKLMTEKIRALEKSISSAFLEIRRCEPIVVNVVNSIEELKSQVLQSLSNVPAAEEYEKVLTDLSWYQKNYEIQVNQNTTDTEIASQMYKSERDARLAAEELLEAERTYTYELNEEMKVQQVENHALQDLVTSLISQKQDEPIPMIGLDDADEDSEDFFSQQEDTPKSSSSTSGFTFAKETDDVQSVPADRIDAVWNRFFENMANASTTSSSSRTDRQHEIRDLMLDAVISNKIEYLENLLLEGYSPELCDDEDSRTCLHHACVSGNHKVAAVLVDNGANLDALDMNDNTALHLSCELGSVKCARLLLESAARTDVKNSDGDTALHKAAWNGHLGCVQLLVEGYGADHRALNKYGHTPVGNVLSRSRIPLDDLEPSAPIVRTMTYLESLDAYDASSEEEEGSDIAGPETETSVGWASWIGSKIFSARRDDDQEEVEEYESEDYEEEEDYSNRPPTDAEISKFENNLVPPSDVVAAMSKVDQAALKLSGNLNPPEDVLRAMGQTRKPYSTTPPLSPNRYSIQSPRQLRYVDTFNSSE